MIRTRSERPRAWRPAVVVAVLTVLALVGCSESERSPVAEDPPAETPADEFAAHDGKVCPVRLPRPHEGDSFGPDEPATSAPSLAAPEKAWVCQYLPNEAGTGPDGRGTEWGWVRKGQARPVAAGQLPAMAEHLTALVPAKSDAICTMELGPRWMLVYSHGTDLTGVVVDDFGCRDLRLTDDPFEVVPGESSTDGIVPGALQAPAGLLEAIKKAARAR